MVYGLMVYMFFFFRISILLEIYLIFEKVTKETKAKSYIKIYNYKSTIYSYFCIILDFYITFCFRFFDYLDKISV